MQRIDLHSSQALFGVAATRAIEQAALRSTPAHSLMTRAGQAAARLAIALAPHARCIWVACGPGNNGGDGLVAATHLQQHARASGSSLQVIVTHCADLARLPPDAAWALAQARACGVGFADSPPDRFDLAIDALLGIGPLRPAQGALAEHLQRLQAAETPVLCVDLPSGLDADTGQHLSGPLIRPPRGQRHTLSLLTLKPGLFTADGRDQAGTVWLDDLGIETPGNAPVTAWLHAKGTATGLRAHATHKGTGGDVLVIGGQGMASHGAGMAGAAILAARAALHAGAGRVYLGLLEGSIPAPLTGWDPISPEIMFRTPAVLMGSQWPEQATVVCGCGGGAAIEALLPEVLARAHQLVLDADGLNHLASSAALQTALRRRGSEGRSTVITPHPLEAARLLGIDTQEVMADRLRASQELANRFGATCVLKGSGTVTCSAGGTPFINASGNALLATAGTGDVLAGMIGAALAAPDHARPIALRTADAVWHHGWRADCWQAENLRTGEWRTLTADGLARGITR